MSVPSAIPADIELVDDFGRKLPVLQKDIAKNYPQKQRFRTIKTGHNDYAHIWESTLTPGSPQMATPCGCHEYQVEYNSAINGATLCRSMPENSQGCCGVDPAGQSGALVDPGAPLKRTELTYEAPRYYVMDRESVLADVVFDAERCDVHKPAEGIPVSIPEPPSSLTTGHHLSAEDILQHQQQQMHQIQQMNS